jgi:hypothetical protein
MRKVWRIHHPNYVISLLAETGAGPEERDRALSPAVAYRHIHALLPVRDPALRSLLLSLLREIGTILPGPAVDTGWLLRRTEEALRRRRLLAVTTPHPVGYGLPPPGETAGEPAAPAPAPKEETETTWIELELVDDAGEPVPSEPFVVELSDGTKRNGSLDSRGKARIEGIPHGACKVTFSGFDAREWGAA